MIINILLILLLVVCLIIIALMAKRAADQTRETVSLKAQAEALQADNKIRQAETNTLKSENARLQEESTRLRVESGQRATEIDLLRSQAQEEAQKHADQLRQQQQQAKEMMAEQMRNAKEQMEAQLAANKQQMEAQLTANKEQIANLSRQLLEQNSAKLKQDNAESMNHLTQPLREAMDEVRKAIGESMKDSAQHSASMREQIKMMLESNRLIGDKAESLANVLRRDNKAAGNMGEIILGDLLASQGLTEGIHYEVQARLRDAEGRPLKNDDTGREMQPDVILHYPQGQDAIIDSKVSLTAYERYVNAQDPAEKERALQDHLRSVRQHVAELARKDYSKYVKAPREAVDFVIMFVPFESSLQLALANDPTLWREAFDKKVFITGEQNLLGILHIVHIAWVQNQQAENQEKVFGIAEQLIDRLGDFIKRYHDLGDAVEKVRKAYDFADNKLISGQQSVVKKGRELIDMGAKENPNRRIPMPELALDDK